MRVKHDDLRSIAHNVAASLASGISFLIGFYELDVFADAARSPTGDLVVNFLGGTVKPTPDTGELARAIAEFPAILPAFCQKHGVPFGAFREMQARYRPAPLGGRFTVRITDHLGRQTETDYEGYHGQRVRAMDKGGRVRPSPVRSITLEG